jgi:hypothetical protein
MAMRVELVNRLPVVVQLLLELFCDVVQLGRAHYWLRTLSQDSSRNLPDLGTDPGGHLFGPLLRWGVVGAPWVIFVGIRGLQGARNSLFPSGLHGHRQTPPRPGFEDKSLDLLQAHSH